MQKLQTKVEASVNIVPKGSQVVILSLIAILAFCLACTFFFVWKGVDYLVPAIASVIVLTVIVLLWKLSARHVDDASIPPVNIASTDGDTSTAISLHHRSLPAVQDQQLLANLLSIVQHRKPLPEPDGLVDSKGNPVPQSQGIARNRIQAANEQAQQMIDQVRSMYSPDQEERKLTQSSNEFEPEIGEGTQFNKASGES